MQVNYTLQLPRDALSVPVVRRVLRTSMHSLGIADDCVNDIEVALAEACTNVLDHAAAGDEYEVVARLDEDRCVIEIVDTGHGFDSDDHGRADAEPTAEAGRGIQLIRALVDNVHFRAGSGAGTVVHFEKRLLLVDDAAIRRLADRSPLREVRSEG